MARRTAIRQSIVAHGDAYARIAVAELDFTAIQTAFDQGRTAYASLNYSQAVESYTQALDALYTNLTSILLHRAAAYEMQHIYERVLDDCDRADGYQSRSSSSGTPDVYFFRANAHVLQGDLKQGALVYRKGFETFPACTELGKKFNQLMAEMETRNKWLTFVLPYEIIAKILSMLTMKERIRFASTCRFWNEFIMREWHGMWQTIDTTKRDNMPRCSSTIPSFIRAIQPQQVRNLVLDMNDSLDEVEEYESEEDKEVTVYYRSKLILEAMLQGRWSKLESLVAQKLYVLLKTIVPIFASSATTHRRLIHNDHKLHQLIDFKS
ncbi:hypothetical protein BDB00DRAFT_791162 [Zychaea mexicana]|uniref:uncharacterized protein n=1 Tax=Zychaea mexicana TaxID=64656 RepID=UPI0022FE1101|nr:uncharacterized protein BDB00DRAFT_791162 [Zychaea mexicana]KAI9489370.1 hypothetical protein BDB00DRAFT_791162 [Zychaea mexicana]